MLNWNVNDEPVITVVHAPLPETSGWFAKAPVHVTVSPCWIVYVLGEY